MFKKYLLNFGYFKFFSFRSFSDMQFADSWDLYRHLQDSGAQDCSTCDPVLFDSKEEALKKLAGENTCVSEVASVTGYEFDVEFPFLEEWDCFEDIHRYDPDAMGSGHVIAVAAFQGGGHHD